MPLSYRDSKAAQSYVDFLNSTDGKIQQDILLGYIRAHIPKSGDLTILDIGCGSGWLLQALQEKNNKIYGCDISPDLVDLAKNKFPTGSYKVADICKEQPFDSSRFDVVILNMVAHDLDDQKNAFKNIQDMLKPNGIMLLTVINPYYAFPVGQWKRGLMRLLSFQKPILFLKEYNFFVKKDRQFLWKKNIPGFFYTLPETINNALSSNFKLLYLEEVISKKDSKDFDLNYRLFRFPIILLLKFEKVGDQSS